MLELGNWGSPAMRWANELQQLQRDRQHGSLSLLERFVALCHQMQAEGASAEDFHRSIEQLLEAHPAMALFRTLARRFQMLLSDGALAEAFPDAADSFLQDVQQHIEQAAELAAAQLPAGITVLTHSASSHVQRVLQKALQRGKSIRLFCTVSEPGREGIQLARWAHAVGIPTLLLAESQLGMLLGDIHLFLIGSDAVCLDGVIHKVGTALLVHHLWMAHRPVWVLSCGEKLLSEPWQEKFAGVAPRLCRYALPQATPLYDCTSWEYLTVLITEHGFEAAESVRERLSGSCPAAV